MKHVGIKFISFLTVHDILGGYIVDLTNVKMEGKSPAIHTKRPEIVSLLQGDIQNVLYVRKHDWASQLCIPNTVSISFTEGKIIGK